MSSTLALRFAAAILASAGLWVAYTQQPPPAELTVTKVADDLHVIVGSGGNVGVYTTDEGVILIDDKFDQNVPAILEKVKSITDKPIRYVLNTHLHGDHTGGNARLLAAGAEIVAHDNARTMMVEKKMPGLPRLTYANRFTVHLGGKRVEARHFGRGHTRSDAFMYFPAHKIVHTGDMFVAGGPFIDYTSGGSGVEWTSTLDAVLRLDFDTVIPGHGPIMKRDDLLKWKQSFEMAKEQVRQLKSQGKTREEAAAAINVDSLPGWAGASRNWNSRSLPGLWDELGAAR
jgi:glyoxylase-like metal-dependent hydrolase (beta-lactamase superfamily II)